MNRVLLPIDAFEVPGVHYELTCLIYLRIKPNLHLVFPTLLTVVMVLSLTGSKRSKSIADCADIVGIKLLIFCSIPTPKYPDTFVYYPDLYVFVTTPVNTFYNHTLPSNRFTDPDGDTLNYRLLQSLEYQKPSWLNFDPATNRIYGTPDSNAHRPFQVQLEVSDSRGGFAYHLLEFSIPNSPPQVRAGIANLSIAVNQVRSVLIPDDAFLDLDGDNLLYDLQSTVDNQNVRQGLVSSASNVLTFVPQSRDQGRYQFRLTARDGYGGVASDEFELVVPNTRPVLAYLIPAPLTAAAGRLFNHEISSDNFQDGDQDELVYQSQLADGMPLPDWLRFNPLRRVFAGTPTGLDRGHYPVRVWVEDVVGAQAEGFFNLTVANSVPQILRPMRQQAVSQLESTFRFAIDELVDPDGDLVTYEARLGNGEPLPAWILFDPVSREFVVTPQDAPNSGNYPINVIATDSTGESRVETFDLTVQAPPDIPQESSNRLQYIVGVGGGLIVLVLAVMGRANRIKTTNFNLKKLSQSQTKGMEMPRSDDEMNDLMGALIKQIRCLESGGEDQLIIATQRYTKALTKFAHVHTESGLISRLRVMDLFNEFCDIITSRLVDKTLPASKRFNQATFSLVYALNLLVDAVTLAIAQQGNLVDKYIERKWISRIDRMKRLIESMLFGTEYWGVGLCQRHTSLMCVQTLYALNSLYEATVYLPDTSTLIVLLKASALHLFSPIKLLRDLRFIVTNVPSKWYMAILSAKIQKTLVLQGETSQAQCAALRALQLNLTKAIQRKFVTADWRLSYGALQLLIGLVKNDMLRVEAKLQLTTGKTAEGEQLLGLETFVNYSHWVKKARARWIREAALNALGWLAHESTRWGDGSLQAVLSPYTKYYTHQARSSFAATGRRQSRVRRMTVTDVQLNPVSHRQFIVANPLLTRTRSNMRVAARPVTAPGAHLSRSSSAKE